MQVIVYWTNWISILVSNTQGEVFLKQKAGQRVPGDMLQYLKRAPDVDPVVGDEAGD